MSNPLQIKHSKGSKILLGFWISLDEMLDLNLKNSTKTSQFLLQVLVAGYPKFKRIFNDLGARIELFGYGDFINGNYVSLRRDF